MQQHVITVDTHRNGQGMLNITSHISPLVHQSNISQGLCQIFVQHTSCSLVIQENADPSAKYDLEQWMCRLAPENDPLYTHTLEGSDDMPAHLKSAITKTSELIPIINSNLGLGTWQGIYLWEHRRHGGARKLVVTCWD